MASPPAPLQLRSEDFPKGIPDQQTMDKLLLPLTAALSATSAALTQNLSVGDNLLAQVVPISFTTPISDWNTLTLATGWTSTVAQANGFSAPRYRIGADGTVYLSGACEYSAALPLGSYPVTVLAAGSLPVTDFNEDVMAWVQKWDYTGPPGAHQSGVALLRVDSTGALTFRSYVTNASTGPTGNQGAVEFLSLDMTSYTPYPPFKPVLSCFPFKAQSTISNPSLVLLANLSPGKQGAGPTSAGAGAGGVGGFGSLRYHTQNRDGIGSGTVIIIDNIPGCALNTTYTGNLLVLK